MRGDALFQVNLSNSSPLKIFKHLESARPCNYYSCGSMAIEANVTEVPPTVSVLSSTVFNELVVTAILAVVTPSNAFDESEVIYELDANFIDDRETQLANA